MKTDLYKQIKKYYNDDFINNERPLCGSKLKLMCLKSNNWRKLCKEFDYPNKELIGDIIIWGCFSGSGDYTTYWDVIQHIDDNCTDFKTYTDYTTSDNPKVRKKGNEFLKMLEDCDMEFGGFTEVNFSKLIK